MGGKHDNIPVLLGGSVPPSTQLADPVQGIRLKSL